MTAYRVVLPEPWERISLGPGLEQRVDRVVTEAVRRVSGELPPDQLATARHRLKNDLLTRLQDARANGGVDYFLPTDLMHGKLISSTFVVSVVRPDALATADGVPAVMAALLAAPGTEPVTIGEHTWVRTERVLTRSPDDLVEHDVRARRVDYRTVMPDDPTRWVLVTSTTLGDGDPDSQVTGVMVQLFDAIMGTWTWVPDPEVEQSVAEEIHD